MIISILSLLAWGWLNHNWIVTGVILILMVSSMLCSWRWDIRAEQFYRIGDFVTLLFVATLVYFALVHTEQRPVFIILEWLPVFFLPVLLAQLYSVNNQLPLGTLFYSQRKREHQLTLDFKLPYAAICWLAAGAANDVTFIYFMLSIASFSAMLWTVRSKNSPLILWLIIIALSAGLSFFGQQGLRQLHAMVEERVVDWFTDWYTDPFKSMTAIGDIGKLKLSDKIEFRVKAEEPLLLLQASYDRYAGQSWLATQRVFTDKASYSLADKKAQTKHLEVFQSLKRATVLALPAGTVRITGLEGAVLQYTPLGAVKLTEAPDFMNYQIFYTGLQVDEVREYDLQIPEQHQTWIAEIQQELKLEQQPPEIIAQAIKQYFQDNYYYTVFLGKESDPDKALVEFILNRKAGHCEYFAVASVFLLRSYGIPARLANGYAMLEFSERDQMYIVRRRHAHAWAIAQIEGYWQAVDATPAQWLQMEEQQTEFLQPVYDLFSTLYFYYKQWRYQQAQIDEQSDDRLIWLIIVLMLLIGFLGRLIISRQDLVQLQVSKDEALSLEYPGLDSELYAIEKAIAKTDKARMPNESVAVWAKRIDNQELIAISKMHYRYRFDEGQFTGADRIKLKQAVAEWLV